MHPGTLHLRFLPPGPPLVEAATGPVLQFSSLDAARLSLRLKQSPPALRDRLLLEGGDVVGAAHLPALVFQAIRLGFRQTELRCSGVGLADGRMAEKLRTAGLHRITLLLHGLSAAVHDRMTGAPGSFDAACRGARSAREAGLSLSLELMLWQGVESSLALLPAFTADLGVSATVLRYPPAADLPAANLERLPDAARLTDALRNLLDRAAAPQPLIIGAPQALSLALATFPSVTVPGTDEIERELSRRLPPGGEDPLCLDQRRCAHCPIEGHCEEARRATRLLRQGDKGGEINMVLQSDCRNNCVFCTMRNMDPPDAAYPHTPREQIDIQMQEGRRRGGTRLVFVGTEPLEYRNLPDLIAHARSLGYEDVVIQTHGEDCADSDVTDRLVKAGLTGVRIGVYGPAAHVHDAVTREAGSFDRVMAALTNLFRRGVRLHVHTTLCRLNMEHLRSLEQMLEASGFPLAEYKLVAPFTRDLDVYRSVVPSYRELLAVVAREAAIAPQRVRERMLRRISNNIVPPCCLAAARRVSGMAFDTGSPHTDRDPTQGYQRLQTGIGQFNADGSLNSRFLSQSRHDIKTALSCPHQAICAAGTRCPGLYQWYVKAYGLDEFDPLPSPQTD